MTTTYDPFKDRSGPFKKSLPSTVHPVGLLGGTGDPEGVVPANVGALYQDTSTNYLYQKQLGTGTKGWSLVGIAPNASSGTGTGTLQVFSGTADDPNGTIAAVKPALYYSTVTGSLWIKTNEALNNTGWEKLIG